MKLPTSSQRRALHLASRKGGGLVCRKLVMQDDGSRGVPRGMVRPQVANVLVGRGWATLHGDTLLITPAGRGVLAAPVPDVPVFLRERDGLTSVRGCSVRGEAEVMDPATLSGFWGEDSLRKLAVARDRRAEAKRRANALRRAA